jgi:hypothetical protein
MIIIQAHCASPLMCYSYHTFPGPSSSIAHCCLLSFQPLPACQPLNNIMGTSVTIVALSRTPKVPTGAHTPGISHTPTTRSHFSMIILMLLSFLEQTQISFQHDQISFFHDHTHASLILGADTDIFSAASSAPCLLITKIHNL